MPYSSEHKQQSREKILHSAFHCFSHNGYENTSIDEIMQHARLTRGAFYAHFSSKSELYQHALLSGARNSRLADKKPAQLSERQWMQKLVKSYLHIDHVTQKASPCPLAFLVTDVANSEPEVKHTYTKIFQRMNQLIHHNSKAYSNCSEQQIYALTAMMIGGVAIGRTLDKPATLDKLLAGCEAMALKILGINPKS